MLEHDFNELDNDFITIYAKILLNGPDKQALEDLERLAELGQINAIQKWYEHTRFVRQNKAIDRLAREISGYGPEQMLVKSNYSMINNHRKLDLDEWYELYRKSSIWRTRKEDARMKDLEFGLTNSDYINCFYDAIRLCIDRYEYNNNLLFAEKYFELVISQTKAHGLLTGEEYIIDKKEFLEVRNRLLGMYNKETTPANIAFTLAKNLTLFKASRKQKALATKILTELSNRKFSKKFEDYKVGNKRLIERQIEKGEFEEKTVEEKVAEEKAIKEEALKKEAKEFADKKIEEGKKWLAKGGTTKTTNAELKQAMTNIAIPHDAEDGHLF